MDQEVTESEERDAETVQAGIHLGYGHWLTPIVNSNDIVPSTPKQQGHRVTVSEFPSLVPQRRGRGRPRVNRVRDESAIEVGGAVSSGFRTNKVLETSSTSERGTTHLSKKKR